MMQAYFIRSFLCLLLLTSAAVQAQVTVIADGPGNTYELMDQKGYGVESPDCGHAVKHINEVMDAQLGKYVFAFTLHRDLDDDRCGATDRQRIELRGKGSEQQGTQGSTSYYRWKFKLDANFQESPNFCHIMQLKAYGNGHGSGAPIITLTPRYNNKMEIGHTGLGGAVATANLSLFKGVWAEAHVKIKHDNNGTLEFVIKRLSDGVTLLSYTNNSLDMWEDGAGYGAPKFGFYRSLTSPSYLRDETIYLADICVTKGTTNLCPSGVGTACVPASASTDDGNVPANVLDNDLNTRWSASGNPQWIQLCLSSTQTVSGVQIAFYSGTTRRSNFDIQVSTNGTSFTNVATGLQSSGTSNALETFNFSPQSARYVRIVGHGNTVNAWNSYTEMKVLNGSSFVSSLGKAIADNSEALNATPNPFTQQTTVSFDLKTAGQTRLAVYDITGKVVAVLVNGNLPAGKHTIPFKCAETPPGSYILRLQHGGRSVSRKLQKL
ncbi:discoidin domain-containing protein [Chitinophaga niabensis]|uniref:discoidin domain-containing protein n=1 Tax=Chitinophaga niabensis TaxID=536979 RepID=UPI0031BADF38